MFKWKNALLERFAPYLVVLFLGLTLILNSTLVTGIQVAVDYPHHTSYATRPVNCTLLDAYGWYPVAGEILWVDNQYWNLRITEKHFKADRWRTVCDIILTEQNYSGEFPVQGGKILVQLEAYDHFAAFDFLAGPVYRALHVPGSYLLWNGVLLILEIAGFVTFRKLRGT